MDREQRHDVYKIAHVRSSCSAKKDAQIVSRHEIAAGKHKGLTRARKQVQRGNKQHSQLREATHGDLGMSIG